MKYYEQTSAKSWLNTPKGTVWVDFADLPDGRHIQPEDETLRETPLGVNLDLLDEKDQELFKEIRTIDIVEAQVLVGRNCLKCGVALHEDELHWCVNCF